MDISNIDNLIIDAVNNKQFYAIIPDVTVKSHYESRGFRVQIIDDNSLKVSWYNPTVTYADIKAFNGKVYKLFTATHIYLKLTNGKDIKALTPRVVQTKLLDGDDINECYSINNQIILNIYNEIIRELLEDDRDVYIHSGVLSLRQLFTNSSIISINNEDKLIATSLNNEIEDEIVMDCNVYDIVEW